MTDNAPNMIKALRDINEIVETELDDQEELQDGDEEQLASDSPLLEMDTTEEEIEAVRRETEALKQSKGFKLSQIVTNTLFTLSYF